MTEVKKRSFFVHVLAVMGAVFLILCVLFCVTVGMVFYFISHSVKSLSEMSANRSDSTKTVFSMPAGEVDYVAGIKLRGEINDEVSDGVIEKLNTAHEDSHAVAILFDVSSPGGAVVPSQEIYDTIKKIKVDKPVVVYVRELAASGAFYSSVSSSYIVANRGSLIGSIGVIMQGLDVHELVNYLKINPTTLKTGALKDAGSPLRSMNEGDKQYLQSLIGSTREQFVADVRAGRKEISDQSIAYMADGRVVLAPEALKLKLIDKVGSQDDALAQVAKLLEKEKAPKLYYYEDIENLSDILANKLSGSWDHAFESALSSRLEQMESPNNRILLK